MLPLKAENFKHMKNIFALLVLFGFLLTLGCESNNNNPETDTYSENCCRTPPVLECYKGSGFYIPNAFTPNFDGINDAFVIFGGSVVREVAFLEVKNPAGEVVFEQQSFQPNDFSRSWDGSNLDGEIVADIYSFEGSVEAIDGTMLPFSGEVCVKVGLPPPCLDRVKYCTYGTQHDGEGGFDRFLPSFEDCQ